MPRETEHRVRIGDARSLEHIDSASVDLVVTSPPYPMIEMWDDVFADLHPDVGPALATGDGAAAFAAMHQSLCPVWEELARVLVPGGIACIVIGDATRTIDDTFRVYPNHAAITEAMAERGFAPLPEVLWRKPTNSAAKFMGSGMVPPNAYVTLEHEHILVFRNGDQQRSFEPQARRRYEAAYFWEERNRWFSDVWTDVRGTFQALGNEDLRNRSAAFPFAIPYRLINMYSVYGDTVLDPFLGTGTTSHAAMVCGRNSIGVELESAFTEVFAGELNAVTELSRQVGTDRLAAHRAFVREREKTASELAYDAVHYDFPVMTKQERELRIYSVGDVRQTEDGAVAAHTPLPETAGREADAPSNPL